MIFPRFLVDDILQPDKICLLEIIKQVASLFFGARKLCLLGRTKILNASSWSSQKKSLKDKDIIYIHTLYIYIYIIYIYAYILIPSPKYQIPFTLKPKNSSWICWIPNKGHKTTLSGGGTKSQIAIGAGRVLKLGA
jgi:hypothetical protein